MMWGDRDFGIEAVFVGSEGKWRFGQLKFWARGEPLGDFEDTTDLASAGRWGRTFLQHSAERTRPDLEGLDAAAVFHELFGQFVARNPIPLPYSWNRNPFLLDDIGEASLRDRVSLVAFRQTDGYDRIVVRSWKSETTSELRLPPGQLDRVIAGFCEWTEVL